MSAAVEDVALAIDVLETDRRYSGFRNVDTITYRERESGLEAKREIVVAQNAVAVIAHDPQRDLLVMVRQFRLGAQMGTGRGFCAEVVAGLIDVGEDAAIAVARELEEETGLTPSHVEKCCSFLTTPGMTDEVIDLFYAQVDSGQMAAEAGEAGETEQTFPFTLTLDEALAAIDENRITNGIAMLAILWFARHRETLTGATS